ncbi:MAG: hypothetical protein WC606_01705 [Candidatus Absconditabacterales bacterium]
MKKSLLLIFLAAIVLAGCTNKLLQEQLSAKNQECASYRDTIQKKLGGDYLNEIFYSPVKNSCIYITIITTNAGGITTIEDYNTNESIATRTSLTPERCNDSNAIPNEKDRSKCWQNRDNVQMEFDKKIQELKGE